MDDSVPLGLTIGRICKIISYSRVGIKVSFLWFGAMVFIFLQVENKWHF